MEFLNLAAGQTGTQGVEGRVIRGFKVMSLGEARGHGVIVDDISLNQLLDLADKKPNGLKVRFTHPDSKDGLGSFVGDAKNFRMGNGSVLADLYVSDVTSKSPTGDVGAYVLDLASKHPDRFGASAVVKFSRETVHGQKLPSLRVTDISAIDLVDEPAANVGLFSAREEISLAAQPENAAYLREYVMQEAAYKAAGITCEEFIGTRRVDDGLDVLTMGTPATDGNYQPGEQRRAGSGHTTTPLCVFNPND